MMIPKNVLAMKSTLICTVLVRFGLNSFMSKLTFQSVLSFQLQFYNQKNQIKLIPESRSLMHLVACETELIHKNY